MAKKLTKESVATLARRALDAGGGLLRLAPCRVPRSLLHQGRCEPEFVGEAAADQSKDIFIGGQKGKEASFEGKLDEVAIYNRAISVEEIHHHFQLAGFAAGTVAVNPR